MGWPVRVVVFVAYDPEAKVYVATSPNLKGMVAEAASLDELKAEVDASVLELLNLNHRLSQPLPVRFDFLEPCHA